MRKLSNPDDQNIGIMTGDHDHLHHRILSKKQDQSKTALILYSVSALITVGTIISVLSSDFLPALTYLLLLLGISAAIRSADVELLDSAKLVLKGLRIPQRSMFLTLIHPMLDFIIILAAFFLTAFLCFQEHTQDTYTLLVFLCYVTPFILVLVSSDIYKTYWLRTGINRYFMLVKLLLLAFGLALFFSYSLYDRGLILQGLSAREFFAGSLLFGILVITLIAFERFEIRYLESFGFRWFYLKNRMQ